MPAKNVKPLHQLYAEVKQLTKERSAVSERIAQLCKTRRRISRRLEAATQIIRAYHNEMPVVEDPDGARRLNLHRLCYLSRAPFSWDKWKLMHSAPVKRILSPPYTFYFRVPDNWSRKRTRRYFEFPGDVCATKGPSSYRTTNLRGLIRVLREGGKLIGVRHGDSKTSMLKSAKLLWVVEVTSNGEQT